MPRRACLNCRERWCARASLMFDCRFRVERSRPLRTLAERRILAPPEENLSRGCDDCGHVRLKPRTRRRKATKTGTEDRQRLAERAATGRQLKKGICQEGPERLPGHFATHPVLWHRRGLFVDLKICSSKLALQWTRSKAASIAIVRAHSSRSFRIMFSPARTRAAPRSGAVPDLPR